DAELEVDESRLAAHIVFVASADAERVARRSSLASSNVTALSIQRSSRIAANARCRRSLAAMSRLQPAFIRTGGGATMDWLMSDTRSIFGCCTRNRSLLMQRVISTG